MKLTGTGVAIVTPFTAQGAVDFSALEKLVRHLVQGGVNYLVVLGTTGESATLKSEEKKDIYQAVLQYADGKVGLVAGIGGNDTAALTNQLEAFDPKGYEAVLSVSPYYNKPNQQGIYEHYKLVAKASPLPIILYNVPGRTGSNMSAETTLKIARDIPNVIATKEASANFEQCMNIVQGAPEGFQVISGDDSITLPFISIGMTGVISVIANAYPKLFSDSVNAALAGDYAKARKLHYQLYDLMKLIFADGSPGGIKYILHQLGICETKVRLPLWGIGDQTREAINAAMKILEGRL